MKPDQYSDGRILSDTHKDLWDFEFGLVYLNHGAFGACPVKVLKAQSRWREKLEKYPVRFFERDYPEDGKLARECLADFLNAEPDNVGFVRNTTSGVNAVLRSLEFKPGDEIVVTDHGYPACQNTVDFIARRSGAKVVVVPIPFPIDGPDVVLDRVVSALTKRTRIVLIDHVTSHTALVLPIEEIVREVVARDIEILVDGAHAPGMLPLDLKKLGAHYYTGNCHKWLCAPKGAAFLHVRSDCKDKIHPLAISLGATSPLGDQSRFRLEFDWQGTDDVTAYLSVTASIQLLGSKVLGGWPALMEQNRALALEARALLCTSLGVDPPCPEEMIGSIAAIAIPTVPNMPPRSPFAPHPWQVLLRERHNIEVPVNTWNNPPSTLVRISAQLYNDIDQYKLLAGALVEILADA